MRGLSTDPCICTDMSTASRISVVLPSNSVEKWAWSLVRVVKWVGSVGKNDVWVWPVERWEGSVCNTERLLVDDCKGLIGLEVYK